MHRSHPSLIRTLLLSACLVAPGATLRAQDAPAAPPAPGTPDAASRQSSTSDRTVTERVTTIRETQTTVLTREQAAAKVFVAAIFVKNRAPEVPDAKVSVLEDFVTSKLTDRGFKVISREDTINSVKDFADAGPNRGSDNLPGADLDQLLSNNTSASRLAQNLGADYVLVASITSCASDVTDFEGYGVKSKVRQTTMNVSYKLLDAGDGGSLTGDVVEVSRKDRATANLPQSALPIDAMLKQSAESLANMLGAKADARRIRLADPKPAAAADFTVNCEVADITIPEVLKDTDGQYTMTPTRYKVDALNATVALDGVVVGTAPGTLPAARGLHKIRVSRPGFRDWEQTISLQPGMTLNVPLQMDNEGYARWVTNTAFIESLKTNSKLTDAQVKAWEGLAQMLRQSGYKVDVKKRITSNTTGTVERKTEYHQTLDAKTSTTAVPAAPRQ